MKFDSLAHLAGARLQAPDREVVELVDLVGPRGGKIWLYLLDCGHSFWQRGGKPKLKSKCIGCGIDAIATHNSPAEN